MGLKYLIADCIVFEVDNNLIYLNEKKNNERFVRHDIGQNSKDILLVLIECKGVISPEEVLERVWRKDRKVEVDVTSVRQAVSKLRKSLKLAAPDLEIVRTIPKQGYLIDATVEIVVDTDTPRRLRLSKSVISYISALGLCVLLVAFYFFNEYKIREINYYKVDDLGLSEKYLHVDIFQLTDYPVEKKLIQIFSQCIEKLDLSDADTIILYPGGSEVITLTALYDNPKKKSVSYRIQVPKPSNDEIEICAF